MASTNEPSSVDDPLTQAQDDRDPSPMDLAGPVVIDHGLQVRLEGKKEPFASFSYALAPMVEHPTALDWRMLSGENVQSQHLRCHKLAPGDKLAALVPEYKRAFAQAVVLVNRGDNYALEPSFLGEWVGGGGGALPVLVLPQGSGEELMGLLEEYDLQGRVCVEGVAAVGAALQHQPRPLVEERPPQPVAIEKKEGGGGMGDRIRQFFAGKYMDLKAEIKKLMFPNNEGPPVILSDDSGAFTMTMATFHQFERAVARNEVSNPANETNEVLKKLLKHLPQVFSRDFPFYLCLAQRMLLSFNVYKSSELDNFVRYCIKSLESMEATQISQVLNTFIQGKDFAVMLGQEDSSTSVFYILELACFRMAQLSGSSQSKGTLLPKVLYYRIMWISMGLKCRCERTVITRAVSVVWKDLLVLKFQERAVANKETCAEVALGVKLSGMLNLPQEVCLRNEILLELFVSEKHLQPLTNLKVLFRMIADLEEKDTELLNVVTLLRASYDSLLKRNDSDKYVLSEGGTLASIIDDGLSFTSFLSEVSGSRAMKDDEMFHAEIGKWQKLFLQLVDLRAEGAEEHLKRFLQGNAVTKKQRQELTKMVVEDMHSKMAGMSIQRMYPLYKAFKIWPNDLLEEYLKSYKVPKDVKICDPSFKEFFGEIVDRFNGAQHHRFLLGFLKLVGDSYCKESRGGEFLLDLIRLDVPKLFAVEGEGDEEGKAVQVAVAGFLHDYIQRNALKNVLLGKMDKVLGFVSKGKNEFHQIILSVLQKEIIPELKALQGSDTLANGNLKAMVSGAVRTLSTDMSWREDISPRQNFCWGIVANCCSKIPSTLDSFEWLDLYSYLIDQLAHVYHAYCNVMQLGQAQRVLSQHPVPRHPSPDVKKYFDWIQKVQDMLLKWKEKLVSQDANYDDILLYASHQTRLQALGQKVYVSSAVVDSQIVQQMKNTYLEQFELLNAYLIRYVPGQPDTKWCTLPTLLSEHGACLPMPLQEQISRYVRFEHSAPEELLTNPIHPRTTGLFQPGHEVSLHLTKETTVTRLCKMNEELERFLVPVIDHLDMLVFFQLNHSEMFKNYLRLYLEKEAQAVIQDQQPTSSSYAAFSFAVPKLMVPKEPKESDLVAEALTVLKKALVNVKNLLLKLMQGTATYSEIIAEGSLQLDTLDIEQEFNILTNFSVQMKLPVQSCEGLNGVRNMLELFQFTRHIQVIKSTCEQYHLTECLRDPEFKELLSLVEELRPEGNRARLTPREASKKMEFVKRVLFLEKVESYKCLELFSTVSDSAAFFQFVRDKRFVGEKGQAVFRQQYELITAQLQHEEYDEGVLNHLYAAFEFILPFTDPRQRFSSLMKKVTRLDVSHGLKQLDTVNSNITLIRLWFSRAEGDTLENVANELDCILATGFYQFSLSNAKGSQIALVYEPSLSQAAPALQQQQQLQQQQAPPQATPGAATPTAPGARHLQLQYPQIVREVSQVDEAAGVLRGGTEKWSREQINDFVRKLGFLDSEAEGGEKIKRFIHLNETTNKLLKLYTALREAGHPDYFNQTVDEILLCSVQTADCKVQDAEKTLMEWTEQVAALRVKYSWLLFMGMPKLLKLFQLLTNPSAVACVDKILQEISFLFSNERHNWLRVREEVKSYLTRAAESILRSETPMHVVGKFLAVLFANHSLPTRRGLGKRPPSVTSRSRSYRHEYTHTLHYCPGYSQKELVQLIVSICNGVPESYEVFHCHKSSSREELELFLKRALHHPLHYLMLEVNKLPFKLQEYLLQFHLGGTNIVNITDSVESSQPQMATIQFIETSPSILREMPWILLKEHKVSGLSSTWDEARRLCVTRVAQPYDFACIQLVCGDAGDGKTHYIKQQLASSPASLTIAINEAFTPLATIKMLNALPSDTKDCAIFFNFTLLPPGEMVDKNEHIRYKKLMEVIGWFFFDLFILGYVEDPVTGHSFRMPGGLAWSVYIEVPSRDLKLSAANNLKQFCEEIPTLWLIASAHFVHQERPYAVDSDVQLVCKYLRAYETKGPTGIDRLYKEVGTYGGRPVKFSTVEDLSEEECQRLLKAFMPEHISRRKVTQRLFVKYMKRRCAFLDNLPAFNYNSGYGEYQRNERGVMMPTDTRKLGSTLMETMLKEVSDFCDPAIKENWSLKPHQQLIYDFKDGGASLGLLSLHPERLPEEEKDKFKKIGGSIPSMTELHSRVVLDSFLSRALNVELEEGRLTLVDDCNYVLTLDYTIKMLNIHERYECGVPVIIEGETGVGKTALVQMLSKLWNHSLLLTWKRERRRILEFMRRKLGEISVDSSDSYERCVQVVEAMSVGHAVKFDDLLLLCMLPDANTRSSHFYTVLRDHLQKMRDTPVLSLLETDKHIDSTLDDLFQAVEEVDEPEPTAALLEAVLTAHVKSTFHKLNVHAALTASEIRAKLQPVFNQALMLEEAFNMHHGTLHVPFVTVFLDEVNTSSCVGLFKELIVDRSFEGEPIPDNIFIVAACNPHRGSSLASHTNGWVRGSYYVRQLHPTLQFLMWDYGALDQNQEASYINAKMKMLNKQMKSAEVASLTDLIVTSQDLMRTYALQQLRGCGLSMAEARMSSRSTVSQRDIQRIFTFYEWLMSVYSKYTPHGERVDYHRRAVLVALGIVYYMRLDHRYREQYRKYMDETVRLPNEVCFSQALEDELNKYMNHVDLPAGIAKIPALKENLFATIVCTVTHTPLIIVGAPGSSKTLSFNLAISNLKGQESKMPHFRNTEIFPSLDPHYYQCSRRTTSNEIQTVFSRAINRQRSYFKISLPIHCVVFMDEAGLPEESHESLKVLHYYLDSPEVSFVAITNHMLDAAKTNRAVSLFRPEASEEDLKSLAKGCLCSTPENPPPDVKLDLDMVVKFCPVYNGLMLTDQFKQFFGLRDFIHFINYLRRHRKSDSLSSQLVMDALERNFNGSDEFDGICKRFLQAIDVAPEMVRRHDVLHILSSSLQDQPQEGKDRAENEVRYKLIVDPSEDDSLVRLLFAFGVLERQNTRMFICSDFPGDGQLQKVNTIAAIRHSAIEGHTVIMTQTDDIHESFYDLFNQRFRVIDDPTHGPRYYTNIAIGAHLKPCRVHPDFQCVVVVKKSEIVNTPKPFLNRFEKYCISHRSLLDTALSHLSPCLKVIVMTARAKAEEFVQCVEGPRSLYGFKKETTLDSLILSILPSHQHKYCAHKSERHSYDPVSADVHLVLMQELLIALRQSAGFHVPVCSPKELALDVEGIFPLVSHDPEFEGVMKTLSCEAACSAVEEAFKVLHKAPAPHSDGEQMEVSAQACLVMSVCVQWLVRHLCKRLMQLMTAEALTLFRNKIPCSYLENYLTYQHHFSLKSLISSHIETLSSCQWDQLRCPTKLLCFTRSTPVIHQLPPDFPLQGAKKEDAGVSEKMVRQVIFSNTSGVILKKVTSLPSQSAIRGLLRSFVSSEEARVLVMVANMQDTSKEMVNHLRIIMEEVETLSHQREKLFVLLLHFPPAMFYEACYPSLYLQGWGHFYLDSAMHSPEQGMINVEDWFRHCCFTQKSLTSDSFLLVLQTMLQQAIPMLSARLQFGMKEGSSFNCRMPPSKRIQVLKDLLLNKGMGAVLCKRFWSYWKPGLLAEHLEKAATFAQSTESTLNISDALQAVFKRSFFDFLVISMSRLNENCNLDVLFDASCTPAVCQLFLDLVAVYPLPKLTQFKLLSGSVPAPQSSANPHVFPFFQAVFCEVEKIVELSRKQANAQTNPLEDGGEVGAFSQDSSSLLGVLQDIVHSSILAKVESETPNFLSVVLNAMNRTPQLWDKYFSDFTVHKLRMGTVPSGFSHHILQVFFGQLSGLKVHLRLACLHSYVHVYQLDLAKMAATLRPVDNLQKLSFSAAPQHTEYLSAVDDSANILGSSHLVSAFVIDTLFSGLLVCLKQDQLSMWFQSYRDTLALPTLRQLIYEGLDPVTFGPHARALESKLHVMQCMCLVLQSLPSSSDTLLQTAREIFNVLFSQSFDKDCKLKDKPLCLRDVLQVSVKAMSAAHHTSNQLQWVVEGLFSHFFSEHKTTYDQRDFQCFLSLANERTHWQARSLEQAIVAGGSQDDLLDVMEEAARTPSSLGVELPLECSSVQVFSLYLSQVLGAASLQSGQEALLSGPLQLYHHKYRSLVGQVICHSSEGSPGPYVPLFYQNSPPIAPKCEYTQNKMMQQPLAHLYFNTVFGHLLSIEINSLLRLSINISKLCQSSSVPSEEKVLLFIEQQAVVQSLLHQLVQYLNPEDAHRLGQLSPVLEDLNGLLDDESMCGGECRGHSMVLAMLLLKRLKSFRKFTVLFNKKYDVICRGINCLLPIRNQLKTKSEGKPHLFPFMLSTEEDTELSSLYQKVSRTMIEVHRGSRSADELLKIAEECYVPYLTASTPLGSTSHRLDKRVCFRMVVWLVAYYEFYDKKITSDLLCNMVGGDELSRYLHEEGFIRLIQCFLSPALMMENPESPNPLREDAVVLRLLPGGGHQPAPKPGRPTDPLHELFTSTKPDQSDIDLRHAMANLVAVVLGSPSRSNHLWYHMFAANELKDTYMTGFMYNAKISPEGLLYDCGVELSPEGQFGRQDYVKHAGRGTYNLHSLYLILWANFASFCMALLTQPDAEAKIHGTVISDWLSVRHYCVSQLRTLWMHMRNNLNISDEERSFFVMRCLKKFFELNSEMRRPHIRGKCATRKELDNYETLWHNQIYQPAWNELKLKFIEYSQLWQNSLFMDIRHLEHCYPYLPSEKDFMHSLLGNGELATQTAGGALHLLAQFTMEKTRLQAGGELLPDLIEFYQWLHTYLAYLLTYDQAAAISIGQAVRHATKKYSKEAAKHLEELYERVKAGYNRYVEIVGGAIGVGACAAGNKIYSIEDKTPLPYFLSDTVEEEEGNDWLYVVMADIVAAHNSSVESLYITLAQSDRWTRLSKILPSEPSRIHPTEFSQSISITGVTKSGRQGTSGFLQLVHSRYCPSASRQQGPSSPPPTQAQMSISRSLWKSDASTMFDFARLQEDVVCAYLAGKPELEALSSLRHPFQFKQQPKSDSPYSVMGSAADLVAISENLPAEFKPIFDATTSKRMEIEFHSMTYNGMVEVILALKIVVEHLIKNLNSTAVGALVDEKLGSFVSKLYGRSSEGSQMFAECNLTAPQLNFLKELRLKDLFHCMAILVQWLEEGLYDFSGLPYALKTQLKEQDVLTLQRIPERWKAEGGQMKDLLEELRAFSEVLVHSESHFSKMITEVVHKPIEECLREFHFVGEDDRLVGLVPKTVLVQHYVPFRIVLRKLAVSLEEQVKEDVSAPADGRDEQQWSELVSDLWDGLTHLREDASSAADTGFIFDPFTGKYGFQDEEDSGSDTESEFEPEFSDLTSMGSDDACESPREDSFGAVANQVEEGSEEDEVKFRERLRQDPSWKKMVLSMAKSLQRETETLEQLARNYSPADVAEFLREVSMSEYEEAFVEAEVSGEVLLEADLAVLEELGVKSALDQIKVQVLFKRKLKGNQEWCPLSEVLHFLDQNKLSHHAAAFEKNAISGDILLECSDAALKQLGVSSALERVKIRTKFKTFVEKLE